MRSTNALFKFSFGDRSAPVIGLTPVYGERCDYRGHKAIVRVHGIHEVAEGGRAVWGGRMGCEFLGMVKRVCSGFSYIILLL